MTLAICFSTNQSILQGIDEIFVFDVADSCPATNISVIIQEESKMYVLQNFAFSQFKIRSTGSCLPNQKNDVGHV